MTIDSSSNMYWGQMPVTDLGVSLSVRGVTERCLVLEFGNGGQDGGEAVVRA